MILIALSMAILTIVLAITGVFGRREKRGGPVASKLKNEGVLRTFWYNRLTDTLKRLSGKSTLPAIVGSIAGATLKSSQQGCLIGGMINVKVKK